MRPNIFFSYSHADSHMVGPVVALLRASEAFVFRDVDDIRPGKKWREEIVAAIAGAEKVVVFWCHHAESSDEVAAEFQAAIAQGKDILPLLVDSTPLPDDLKQYQYIDFRIAFSPSHSGAQGGAYVAEPKPRYGAHRSAPSAVARARRRIPKSLTVGAVLLALMLPSTLLLIRETQEYSRVVNVDEAIIRSPIEAPSPPEEAASGHAWPPRVALQEDRKNALPARRDNVATVALIAMVVVSVLGVAGLAFWRIAARARVVRRGHKDLLPSAARAGELGPLASTAAAEIARSIEAEIRSRWPAVESHGFIYRRGDSDDVWLA